PLWRDALLRLVFFVEDFARVAIDTFPPDGRSNRISDGGSFTPAARRGASTRRGDRKNRADKSSSPANANLAPRSNRGACRDNRTSSHRRGGRSEIHSRPCNSARHALAIYPAAAERVPPNRTNSS